MKLFAWFSKKERDKKRQMKMLAASPYFDAEWYLKQYPEVKDTGYSPFEHYIKIGWKEGKNPSAKFDTLFYLNDNPDIVKSGINPLRHYFLFGRKEGRLCLPPYRKINSKAEKKSDNEQNPKISVLVASYNYEEYIRKTLDSILAQTYKNFEIIVVDDGSEDNSVEIIKEYVKKYPNVFLYMHKNKQNSGLIKTIELGVKKATGKYIAFCEADDYWLSNNLEEKVRVINKYHSPKVIYNNVELFGSEVKRKEEYIAKLSKVPEGLLEADPLVMTYNIIPTFSCVMIDRNVLMQCNFDAYVPTWTDWWLYRQIFAEYPIYHLDKILTMWRIHDSYNGEKKSSGCKEKYDEFIFYNDELIVKKNKKNLDKIYNNEHVKILLNSGLFDEKFYITNYPEVKKFCLPPIYHYLKLGWKLGYNPSFEFDTKAHLNSSADGNPLLNYLFSEEKQSQKE